MNSAPATPTSQILQATIATVYFFYVQILHLYLFNPGFSPTGNMKHPGYLSLGHYVSLFILSYAYFAPIERVSFHLTVELEYAYMLVYFYFLT